MNTSRRLLGMLVRAQRGQAMAEYSSIVFLLLCTTGLLLVQFLPSMITAIGDYIHGFYYVMALPIP